MFLALLRLTDLSLEAFYWINHKIIMYLDYSFFNQFSQRFYW